MGKIIKGSWGKLIVCMFVVVGFLGFSLAQEPAKKIDEGKVLLVVKKADLIIEKIEIKKIGQDPAAIIPPGKEVKLRHQVEISVTVKNRAIGPQAASTADSLTAEGPCRTSAGSYNVLLEWTENPTIGFNFLASAGGVTALDPGASKTVTFTHWVPKGKSYKYRATADNLNCIDELNEGNNVNSAGYMAR